MIKGRYFCSKKNLDQVLALLVLIYNTLIAVGLFFGAPLLLALVVGSAKRRHTFRQRMGWCRYPWQRDPRRSKIKRIWVHALSVGEVMAAQPMVTRLIAINRDVELFFTTSTFTGYHTAERLFKTSHVHLGYFPYDWIGAVRSVAARIDPTHVIVTETDIWPTFLWEMKRRKVPVFMVNLRISDHTWNNYRRFKWVVGKIYDAFDRVCVQTQSEMDRLAELGISTDRISITGNLKFDGYTLPKDAESVLSWRHGLNIANDHRIIVAGSTHLGEEAILCDVLKSIQSKSYDISLIVAPRDPGRAASLRVFFRKNDFQSEFLSDLQCENFVRWPQVIIVDSIGKLKALYRLADIAFVGGSLVPLGGHNPLEPAFWGKPVLFGKDMRDFALIADDLIAGQGAVRLKNTVHMESVFIHLLENPGEAAHMGDNALRIMNFHRGAVDRTLSFLNMTDAQPATFGTKDDRI